MSEELRDEYQFDYHQAKPNRFAKGFKKGGRLIVLDPEVAAEFRESETVNAVLKALLQTMPTRQSLPVTSTDAFTTTDPSSH